MKTNVLNAEITKSYKEHNFEIDISSEDNLGRLFSSLINIYSNKFSFIREFVQNAYDAVVEIWELEYRNVIDLDTFLIENPIILSLYEDTKGTYIEIKETKGVGISPDRMDTMFKYLTKSTKRNSISQIGAKGIGKMAALAYTDEYFLSTIHDNKLYEYKISWYNQQGIPKISEPIVIDTTEHNGTTIRVYLIDAADAADDDVRLVENAITEFLPYFNNIYYNNVQVNISKTLSYQYGHVASYYYSNDKVKRCLNDIKLYKFNTFSYRCGINLYNSELFLIVDRIPYSIDWDILNINIIYLPFGINVSSQDVILNDNRDSIKYTQSVINHINDKIKDFENELVSFIKDGKCTLEKEFLTIWNRGIYFKIEDITFKISSNPFAVWVETHKYISSLANNSGKRDSQIEKLIFDVFLIKGGSKLFKKIDKSYIYLLKYASNRKYQFSKADFSTYVLDINVPKASINSVDITNKNVIVLNKFNRTDILTLIDDFIDTKYQNHVLDILEKYHNGIGSKFSEIYDINNAAKKRIDQKGKIKVSVIETDYYEKVVIGKSHFMKISDITDDYIVFNNTDLKSAKICKAFIDDNFPSLQVIVVAPTFYKKIPYNLNYFVNNNKIFKYINTAHQTINTLFKDYQYNELQYLSNNRRFLNYISLFKDTIINEIMSRKHCDKSNLEIYEYIYKQNRDVSNFFQTFSKDIDKSYVVSEFIKDIQELDNIFHVNYKELCCINYNIDSDLINTLIKIILNKNNCND